MVNHNYEHDNDAYEPAGSWVGPLVGLLVGLLIGGLAGAMAMLFLAPQSGKKTRAKIEQLGHELREQTADTWKARWRRSASKPARSRTTSASRLKDWGNAQAML